MQDLAQNGYTSVEVKKALQAARREISFRYELLNNQNQVKKPKNLFATVRSGHVNNNALSTIKRTARFVLVEDPDINFLSDRIKPYVKLKMPDGGYVEFPQGVFILSTPPRKISGGVIFRDVEAYDLLIKLSSPRIKDRYVVPAGTNYIEAVNTILVSEGFALVNLTPTNKTLPADKDWDPGTTKLQIINNLLGEIEYRSLKMDENGIPVAEPYISPQDRASEHTYKNDSSSVIFPDPQEHLDLFSVPNEWVLVTSEPDRPVLVSSYTNDNPNSPTSTVNRGITVTDFRQEEIAADQAALDAKVQRIAFEASQIYQQVEFRTAIMPMHSDFDVFTLEYTDLGISAKFSEVSWSMDLKVGAEMTHRIRRVVEI